MSRRAESIARPPVERALRVLFCGAPLLLGLLLAVPARAEEELPDLALLEFLGEWEDEEGRWLDPLEFLEREGGQDGGSETSGEQNDDEHQDD